MTKRIITQKRLKEILHYNPETGIFTWKIRQARSKVSVGDAAGCKTKGYTRIKINGKLYSSHRLAWLYVYGVFPVNQLDHINHARSDNRIENLREVTNQENHKNVSKHKRNRSGVNGIHWNSRDSNWKSGIMSNGKAIFLGNFTDKFEAICARKSAEVKYGFHSNHGR